MRLRTKAFYLIAIAAACVVLLFVIFSGYQTEPTYGGYTLSEWLAVRDQCDFANSPDVITRSNEAVGAIRAIGTNGLSFALQWLSYEPSKWDYRIQGMAMRMPFSHSQKDSILRMLTDGERKSGYAISFFWMLSSNASGAIPALTQMAHRTNAEWTSARAMICLSDIGPKALPTITEMLAETNSAIRVSAIRSISFAHSRRGADWSAAMPLLLHYANDLDTNVSYISILTLGVIGREPETCIPFITNKLTSTNFVIRRAAVFALERFRPPAISAVPALLPMLNDPDKIVRSAATNALEKIAPEALANAAGG
jgi:hypothetical protein